MAVCGGQNMRISLGIGLIFFHIISKLAEALVIIYDEIFEAVAAEGDVLLPKPFLYPTPFHPAYSPDSAPLDFHVFGKLI
jgi:hypothetical protein